MTLTDFLLARIAEDEDSVSAYYEGRPPVVTGLEDADPARVLAECEAKRRIVELHTNNEDGPVGSCSVCTDRDYLGLVDDEWPCATIKALALPYADHEQFREDWRL